MKENLRLLNEITDLRKDLFYLTRKKKNTECKTPKYLTLQQIWKQWTTKKNNFQSMTIKVTIQPSKFLDGQFN